jgi:hypothetical protein
MPQAAPIHGHRRPAIVCRKSGQSSRMTKIAMIERLSAHAKKSALRDVGMAFATEDYLNAIIRT